MATLLIQKYQHPELISGTALAQAGLFAPYDIITAQSDTWVWTADEETNPWFRLVRWPALTVAQAKGLAVPLPAAADGSTLARIRPSCLNWSLATTGLPGDFATWWADDTRAKAMYVLPALLLTTLLTTITVARPIIANPAFVAPVG